jgi:hypothetical protein
MHSPEIPNSHRVRFCARSDFCAPGCDWNENYRGRRKIPALSQCIALSRCIYNFTQSSPFFFSFQAYLQYRRSFFWMQSVHSRGSKGYIALCGSWSWSEFMFVRFFRHFVHALVAAKVQIVKGGWGWNHWNLILSYQIVWLDCLNTTCSTPLWWILTFIIVIMAWELVLLIPSWIFCSSVMLFLMFSWILHPKGF